MTRAVIGVIGNQYVIEDRYPVHAVGQMNSEAISGPAGCMPVMIPADPRFVSVDELLATCDGFLLTGGQPNVHPEEYGEAET
ncbi:MAG: gamma-glutamyl-gamma-aminobutyrate hydrolase family protein, partial [Roseovarius sp.]